MDIFDLLPPFKQWLQWDPAFKKLFLKMSQNHFLIQRDLSSLNGYSFYNFYWHETVSQSEIYLNLNVLLMQ